MIKRMIVLIFLMLVLTGCTNPVKYDLTKYLNVELPKLYDLENEVITLYEESKNKNNFYEILTTDIIPNYEIFTTDIKDVSLKFDEIKKIHNLYIKATQLQLNALKILQEGIMEKNNEKVNEANSFLTESKGYMDSFKKELIKSVEKYKIDYKLN